MKRDWLKPRTQSPIAAICESLRQLKRDAWHDRRDAWEYDVRKAQAVAREKRRAVRAAVLDGL